MEARAYKIMREVSPLIAQTHPELLPALSKMLRRLNPCKHSPDFASVVWFGASYFFTPRQADVVKRLWAAWLQGVPEIRQEFLLEDAKAATKKLAQLFANHPAWGTLIVPGRAKGTFRLAESQSA